LIRSISRVETTSAVCENKLETHEIEIAKNRNSFIEVTFARISTELLTFSLIPKIFLALELVRQ
jgi:hypothetical protein